MTITPTPSFRFGATPTDPERLAAAVLASPRLLSTVPAAPLRELFRAYEGATKAAAAARLLPAERNADALAELDAMLRAGEDIDVPALVDKLAGAQVARASRDRTSELLMSLPGRYQGDVVRVIGEHRGLFEEDLGEALDDLLDRAAPVVSALEGIDSADAAIDAGKAEEWTQVKALAREMGDLRRDHRALILVEDRANFGSQSPAWAFAMFRSPAIADFDRIVRGEARDLTGRPTGLPWPIFDTGSVDHLLTVVRRRDQLQPYIGTVDEARAAQSPHPVAGTSRQPALGAERTAYLYAQARNAAATRIADERAGLAFAPPVG
jgi:hypothetical protein